MDQQLVVFRLGKEHFGVDISAVESIIKLQSVTQVPHTPAYILGVTNLRGRILPVIDLRRRLGISCGDQTRESRIIVAMHQDTIAGMLVDSVSEVVTVSDLTIEPPPAMTTQVDAGFVLGIARAVTNGQEHLVLLLDLSKILTKNDVQMVAA